MEENKTYNVIFTKYAQASIEASSLAEATEKAAQLPEDKIPWNETEVADISEA